MDERRRSPRRRLQKSLEIFNLEDESMFGILVDISPEGMLIQTARAVKESRVIELRLLLPVKIFGKDSLDVEARCVRVIAQNDGTGFLCGFEFVEVMPQDVGIILGLIMDLSLPQ